MSAFSCPDTCIQRQLRHIERPGPGMRMTFFKGVAFHSMPMTLGLVLFAASLTPSLTPRDWIIQGILGGILTAIGYLVGRALQLLWTVLGFAPPQGRFVRLSSATLAIASALLWIYAVSQSAEWQNSIRSRLTLPPVDSTQWLPMVLLALAIFLLCFVAGLLVKGLFRLVRARLDRIMPRQTANLLGAILAALLLVLLTRDGLIPAMLRSMDASYAEAQWLFDKAPPAPNDPRAPGGAASMVNWQAMGQPGRNFVSQGPDAEKISALTGRAAMDPIRVYVGRAEDEDPQSRANIALEELRRLGAFEREVLVVASPTGTGWLDPGAHDTLEYLQDGNVATVAVQYSYMQSPMALIFETDTGLDQASATLSTIYRYWRELPKDARPRFYIHGLSLGAWSSMYALDVFEIFGDPIQGAFWAGPPFVSTRWQRITSRRNGGSPYVSPVIADGSLVRFMTQYGGLDRATSEWSPIRIIYLQHASDAIVFYEPESLWRAPQWMREPLAPDVSPEVRFLPIVTQFQLAVDMLLAAGMPQGFGHAYSAAEYVDAWRELITPVRWTEEDTMALKDRCRASEERGGVGCES